MRESIGRWLKDMWLVDQAQRKKQENHDVVLVYTIYFAETTCQVRSMSDLSKHIGGFVSNPSDRTIRNSARNARNRAHVAESVCSSERGESQLEKLNRSSGPNAGRLINRKLHEPPRSALALRQTQNN